MALVFYYAPHSTAETVYWALQELAIPYDLVEMDLKAGDQDKAGYRLLNPNGKVPLLVHDGVAIFESAAIMIHLGETYGVERGLFPKPGLDRAVAMKWIVWTNATLVEQVHLWLASGRAEGPRAQVHERIGILDGELAERPHLVGAEFTLADLHVASALGWLRAIGVDLSPWKNVSAWLDRCLQRPSFVALLAA